MTTKMANIRLNPSQHTLAYAISPQSSKRQRFSFTQLLLKSTIHGTNLITITKQSKSTRNHQPVKRAATASSEYSDTQNYDVFGYCAVKRAFSSMVFIIRELQSFTIQIREILFYEDLHEILIRVQNEMNASFVWLFRQVFSQTPTLMVYVMILLANYSVHSMSHNFTTVTPPTAAVETSYRKFDSSSIKTFSTKSGGRTTSIGGNNGGGGKLPAVSGGTDGDGRSSEIVIPARTSEELWNWIVDEADRMHGVIDREMMSEFVAPVTVRIEEEEDVEEYVRTEVVYQAGLLREPDNPMLLANYAQFLYLVARDYDRAEDYFKRASMVEPKDAEALNKYASFLWLVRKDLWAAEETYLEAISADPNNSYYAANYAHFLWNTGGKDGGLNMNKRTAHVSCTRFQNPEMPNILCHDTVFA